MLKRIVLAAAVALPFAAGAQNRDSLTVARRAIQLAAMVGGAAIDVDTIFAPAFLAQVPPAQMRTIAAQYASAGAIRSLVMTAFPAPGAPATGSASAVFQIATDKGFAYPMTLVVDAAPPHLVTGLFFGSPVPAVASLDDALKALRALPGHASFFAARIDGSRLVPIVAEDTGRALAIGSAFKLYVLAALVREIEQGKRHWADVVPIDSASKSLPSGMLQNWPAGTPVTLQTLATLMISISDNTAADHLARLLGRSTVESMLTETGNTHAAMSQPFLTTREMFALKSPDRAAQLRQYVAGTADQRRAILADSTVTARQRSVPDFSKGPIAIESTEWFASTADLGRVLVWLRDHSASGPAAATRGVLSVNKGIDWPPATWAYAGFKGGSEPGVLNLSFIAQRTDGTWMVFVGTWNDPAKPVNEVSFAGLVQRLRDLAAAK